ncbi:L-2-amino-thiazoline-4-carboxylic acid hydrolase [Streptosporangium sp. KLBMP 9127]|nr:L-2-amino-thiazoline-4-carboxylic acid hydrolase [Streptosporangium sp. KLBMP 9127]
MEDEQVFVGDGVDGQTTRPALAGFMELKERGPVQHPALVQAAKQARHGFRFDRRTTIGTGGTHCPFHFSRNQEAG